MMIQLVRETPPGYGGVERVAHELAEYWGTPVFTLDAKGVRNEKLGLKQRPYKLTIIRKLIVGRIAFPIPSRELISLISGKQPILAHLPCPGILGAAAIAKLMRPKREITIYWHAFLNTDSSLESKFTAVYQLLALSITKRMSRVITTSPTLKKELIKKGCDERKVYVVPCCIDQAFEKKALKTKTNKKKEGKLKIIFIGRLDSYKRVDWLLDSVQRVSESKGDRFCIEVNIIGDGPKRAALEKQAEISWGVTKFWGRVNEEEKQKLLAKSDLLVLPSDRCNEAFGIVQLEAMATGIPALAFDCESSGMGWVCDLPDLKWDKTPEGLTYILQTLLKEDELHSKICIQARRRYIELFSRRKWEKNVERLAT